MRSYRHLCYVCTMKTQKVIQLGANLYEYNEGALIIKDLENNVLETISKVDMLEINDQYKGANRIHKPFALLFWIDCKNGNYSNWIK